MDWATPPLFTAPKVFRVPLCGPAASTLFELEKNGLLDKNQTYLLGLPPLTSNKVASGHGGEIHLPLSPLPPPLAPTPNTKCSGQCRPRTRECGVSILVLSPPSSRPYDFPMGVGSFGLNDTSLENAKLLANLHQPCSMRTLTTDHL